MKLVSVFLWIFEFSLEKFGSLNFNCRKFLRSSCRRESLNRVCVDCNEKKKKKRRILHSVHVDELDHPFRLIHQKSSRKILAYIQRKKEGKEGEKIGEVLAFRRDSNENPWKLVYVCIEDERRKTALQSSQVEPARTKNHYLRARTSPWRQKGVTVSSSKKISSLQHFVAAAPTHDPFSFSISLPSSFFIIGNFSNR